MFWFVLACTTSAVVRAFELSHQAEEDTGTSRWITVRGIVWNLILAAWGFYLSSLIR